MNFTLKRTFIPLIMLCKKPSKKFKDNYLYTMRLQGAVPNRIQSQYRFTKKVQ